MHLTPICSHNRDGASKRFLHLGHSDINRSEDVVRLLYSDTDRPHSARILIINQPPCTTHLAC